MSESMAEWHGLYCSKAQAIEAANAHLPPGHEFEVYCNKPWPWSRAGYAWSKPRDKRPDCEFIGRYVSGH